MYGIIYKITNKINGHSYIGQTTYSLKERWSKHINFAKHHPEQSGLYSAINKYGKENFEIEQIDIAETEDELNEKEVYWISYYNTFYGEGYNRDLGGKGSKKLDLPKEQIIEEYLNTELTARDLGVKYECSDRTIAKILDAAGIKRDKITEKQKKTMSENLAKGRVGRPENFINYRNSLKKKVARLDEKGNILEIYDSLSDACRDLGQSTHHTNRITKAIENNGICFGYHWKRIEK